MKICLIAPVPPFRGGIAKYCYSLAQELENRHDLLLLSYKRQYPALLYGKKSQLEPSGARGIDDEFRRLSYDIDSASIRSWLATVRRITLFRPDLVVLPWWVAYWAPMYGFLLFFLRKRGIRVVFLCVNIFEHEDNALKKLLTKLTLARANSMIVHSEQEKNMALEINPGAMVKKHLLPLFSYDPLPVCERDAGGLRLLFFGFVRPYKGLDTLVRAIGILKDYDISLTIAGEFWDGKAELLQQVAEFDIAGRVTVVDRYIPEDEMRRYFSATDLVVLPYRKTVTSGIIATAYGFGKPVLATDVGGFHEAVRDGCTGKLVPPDDPQALADGIVWFYNNRQIDFAGNIVQFTAKAMSWSSLVDTIEEFRFL